MQNTIQKDHLSKLYIVVTILPQMQNADLMNAEFKTIFHSEFFTLHSAFIGRLASAVVKTMADESCNKLAEDFKGSPYEASA